MFALVSLAAASVVDEHTAFDGVLQFDALQNTVPGIPAIPSAVVATATITVCLTDCGDATLQALIIAAVKAASGASNVVISCGTSCSNRAARSLLQVSGSTGTITLTGATQAELQLLQNNIAAGNLLNVGIPITATVSGATPVTPAAAVAFLGGTPALTPANPASPTGTAICSSTNARLVCIARATTTLALTNCAGTAAVVNSNGVAAGCCACTVKARRALQQTGTGAQVVAASAATTYAQLCNAAPRGYPGCGKRGSKKGLLGLLGLLGLIPLLLCLLICCLCCLRRKRRGQAMLFSQTAVPAPIPAPLPHVHAEPHLHAGPDFHVHP